MGGSTSTNIGGSPGGFPRRQRNSVNYDSPKLGGFQMSAATTSANASTANLTTATANKSRL